MVTPRHQSTTMEQMFHCPAMRSSNSKRPLEYFTVIVNYSGISVFNVALKVMTSDYNAQLIRLYKRKLSETKIPVKVEKDPSHLKPNKVSEKLVSSQVITLTYSILFFFLIGFSTALFYCWRKQYEL